MSHHFGLIPPDYPSHGVINFQLPSIYQFLAADASSVVDYSKDVKVNHNVVDNPLAIIVNLTYAPLHSPFARRNEHSSTAKTPHHLMMTTMLVKGLAGAFDMEGPLCDVPANPIPCS